MNPKTDSLFRVSTPLFHWPRADGTQFAHRILSDHGKPTSGRMGHGYDMHTCRDYLVLEGLEDVYTNDKQKKLQKHQMVLHFQVKYLAALSSEEKTDLIKILSDQEKEFLGFGLVFQWDHSFISKENSIVWHYDHFSVVFPEKLWGNLPLVQLITLWIRMIMIINEKDFSYFSGIFTKNQLQKNPHLQYVRDTIVPNLPLILKLCHSVDTLDVKGLMKEYLPECNYTEIDDFFGNSQDWQNKFSRMFQTIQFCDTVLSIPLQYSSNVYDFKHVLVLRVKRALGLGKDLEPFEATLVPPYKFRIRPKKEKKCPLSEEKPVQYVVNRGSTARVIISQSTQTATNGATAADTTNLRPRVSTSFHNL